MNPPTPTPPIRILHLEDNPRDAAMIRDRLEADGFSCEIVWAETKETFERALEGAEFDIVLCDYNLPGYDGIAAMKLARGVHEDTPVIMISGSLSPDDAIECLKQGTTDYLFKQRLERLVPALRQALAAHEEHRVRKEAEARLAESEGRLRSIVESSLLSLLFWDVSGRITGGNDAFLRLVGFTHEDVAAGRVRWDELTPPEYLELDQKALREIAATGACTPFEKEYVRKDGSRVPILVAGTSFSHSRDEGVAFVVDITRRKRAEEGRRRLLKVLEASLNEIYIFEAQTLRFVYVNAAALRNLGYSHDEMTTMTPLHLKTEITEAAFQELLAPLRGHEKEKVPFQTSHRRADGSLYPVEVHLQLVEHDQGAEFLAVINDITERQETEAALRRSDLALKAVSQGVVITGPDQRVLTANDAFTSITGYSLAEIEGRPTGFLNGPLTDPQTMDAIRTSLARGAEFTGEILCYRKDGATFWNEMTISPVTDEAGRLTHFIGITRDVTARKLAALEDEGETKVLELIAQGGPLSELLSRVLLRYEGLLAGLRGSVLLLDPNGQRLRHGAAPHLPAAYSRAMDGLDVGPNAGSCGTAIHTGQACIVTDIACDPRWNGLKELALGHGLRACWAVPIKGALGRILGALAFYSDAARAPEGRELAIIERGAHLAGLAIERQEAEDALRATVRDKEALLKEVHHRVKNNLQVITSLLRLEAGRSDEPATQVVLKSMQGRLRAMALLHETLYRSGTFESVDLGVYLKQLATQAFRVQETQSGAVQLDLDIASVRLAMDRAIPCGLLLNELISNSLKHGFPNEREGRVRIELRVEDEGACVRLRVSDTGVGLPPDFGARRGRLGLQLVSDLARQLGGRLEVEAGPRAVFNVTFAALGSTSSAARSTQEIRPPGMIPGGSRDCLVRSRNFGSLLRNPCEKGPFQPLFVIASPPRTTSVT